MPPGPGACAAKRRSEGLFSRDPACVRDAIGRRRRFRFAWRAGAPPARCARPGPWAAFFAKLGTAAWRARRDDLARGSRSPDCAPELADGVDGAPGLAKARAGSASAGQRGAAQKQRNLLAPAPRRPREEISNAYKAMIHAESKPERAAKGKALRRKRRLKWRAVAFRKAKGDRSVNRRRSWFGRLAIA